MKAIEALVSGRVQGVGFRAFTRSKAKSLGLKGFVRNLPDGRVEVYAEGDEKALEKLIDYLHIGPFFADVKKVDWKFVKPRGGYEDFFIAY